MRNPRKQSVPLNSLPEVGKIIVFGYYLRFIKPVLTEATRRFEEAGAESIGVGGNFDLMTSAVFDRESPNLPAHIRMAFEGALAEDKDLIPTECLTGGANPDSPEVSVADERRIVDRIQERWTQGAVEQAILYPALRQTSKHRLGYRQSVLESKPDLRNVCFCLRIINKDGQAQTHSFSVERMFDLFLLDDKGAPLEAVLPFMPVDRFEDSGSAGLCDAVFAPGNTTFHRNQ